MKTPIQRGRPKFAKQNGLCHWCGRPMSLEPFRGVRKGKLLPNDQYATFEHLTRRREGGVGKDNNVVLAHAKCNRKRERHENDEVFVSRCRVTT